MYFEKKTSLDCATLRTFVYFKENYGCHFVHQSVSIVLIKGFLLLRFYKTLLFGPIFFNKIKTLSLFCFFISNKIKLLRTVTCNPEFSFLPLKKQMRVTRICSVLLCDCAKMAFSGKMYMVAIW